MKKRILVLVVVAALAVLAMAVVAHAETVEGTGTLVARGVGFAHVEGDGKIAIRGRGVGTICVVGAEWLEVHGRGVKGTCAEGEGQLFTGWRGTLLAKGSALDVKMAGGVIEFRAEGTGVAHLRGRGHYQVGDQSGPWTAEGVDVHFGE